jgi:uncharacterized phage-associated protein
MRDPRIVANYMLEAAANRGLCLTNLSLQKLLFFSYSIALIERKTKLFDGYFEAWQFGPVQPAVYQAFKSAEGMPINFRAKAFDPVSRREKKLEILNDRFAKDVCDRVIVQFGNMSPGRLVDITHAVGGPWHHIVSSAKNGANIGLRISDDVIISRYGRQKVSVTAVPRVGEPDEDAPFI